MVGSESGGSEEGARRYYDGEARGRRERDEWGRRVEEEDSGTGMEDEEEENSSEGGQDEMPSLEDIDPPSED